MGYVALNEQEEWIRSIDFSKGRAGLDFIARQFAGWAPHLISFIIGSVADATIRPIYALPVGHQWRRKAGLPLVGDAAHLMSPFAGEGANLAMYDGAELAQAIIDNPDDIEAALSRYEDALFPRSREVAGMSAQNLKLFFGNAAPGSMVDLFSRFAASDARQQPHPTRATVNPLGRPLAEARLCRRNCLTVPFALPLHVPPHLAGRDHQTRHQLSPPRSQGEQAETLSADRPT